MFKTLIRYRVTTFNQNRFVENNGFLSIKFKDPFIYFT